jgi:hypothetical protein
MEGENCVSDSAGRALIPVCGKSQTTAIDSR